MVAETISNKLSTRISNLNAQASKESIQTLSKWIQFHAQNHPTAIRTTLFQFMKVEKSTTSPQLLVAWNIVHELCIEYSSSAGVGAGANEVKWNALSSFRSALAESTIRPALENLLSTLQAGNSTIAAGQLQTMLKMRDNLKNMSNVWDQANCFDSPTLLDEIKRLVAKIGKEDGSGSGSSERDVDAPVVKDSAIDADTTNVEDSVQFETGNDMEGDEEMEISNSTEDVEKAKQKQQRIPTPTPASTPTVDSSAVHDVSSKGGDTSVADDKDASETKEKESDKSDQVKKDEVSSNPALPSPKKEKQKEFDFESEGIPEGKVEVQALAMPCKSITTMQITRDLRNDATNNLSTLLSSVPAGVFDICKSASAASEGEVDLEQLPAIPDDVLELDLTGALAKVQQHREIIEMQKKQREKCIELLIKSRCKFGSVEAASLFYDLDELKETLKKRKASILDAMELEGLDFDAIGDGDDEDQDDNIGDFSWLSRDSAKKLKSS